MRKYLRIFSIFSILCAFTQPVFAENRHAHPPWWFNGLTFWVPLDDPANPLKLLRGTGSPSFTRATTATYVHPTTGLITSADAGQLRIEANGALIEGQRTNIGLYSDQFGLAATWVATNVTVDNNSTTSPDGTVNAELLTASDANGTVIQDLGVIASAAKVFSVYLKRATGTGNIDLTLDGGIGWTTVAVTSAWTRFEITATLADPDVGIRIVTSGDAVWAWGGQVEAAAFSSSYIPTTTVAVTRNGDVLTLPIANVENAAGSIAGQYDRLGSVTGEFIRHNGASGWFVLRGNGAAQSSIFYGDKSAADSLPTLNTLTGIAMRWSGTSAGYTYSGRTISSVSGAVAPVFGAAVLGIGNDAGSSQLYGHIKHLRIWNRSLSDEEMVAITQ